MTFDRVSLFPRRRSVFMSAICLFVSVHTSSSMLTITLCRAIHFSFGGHSTNAPAVKDSMDIPELG